MNFNLEGTLCHYTLIIDVHINELMSTLNCIHRNRQSKHQESNFPSSGVSMHASKLASTVFIGFFLFPFILAETFYAIPTPSSPCPENPCMTLSQYAAQPTNFFPPNTTILILPGYHSLSSPLTITNILRLELVTNITLPQLDTRVLCGTSARLQLATITEVYISGFQLIGCTRNTMTSVEQFVLEDAIFQQGEYSYGTLLTLHEVTRASIVASTFTGTNCRQTSQAIAVYNSHLRVINNFPQSKFCTIQWCCVCI